MFDTAEADCLLGFGFLEINKCDPLFSRLELKLHSHTFVPLYHKRFYYGQNNIFRVSSTETLSVPPGHVKLIPAHIPDLKQPPIQTFAMFEPRQINESKSNVLIQHVQFDLSDEVIPKAIHNKTYEGTTI